MRTALSAGYLRLRELEAPGRLAGVRYAESRQTSTTLTAGMSVSRTSHGTIVGVWTRVHADTDGFDICDSMLSHHNQSNAYTLPMSGFLGRGPRVSEEQKKRIPPGQYFTEKWPVLHYGSVPRVDLKTWDFKVWGEVDNPFELDWAEFKALPRKSLHTDIHCVTRWSRLDMDFEGVAIQTILERAQLKPSARFVIAHAEQGYTANLPLGVLDDDDVILADMADGAPLTPDHGYPLRLVVPKRYFWKSAKWVRGLQFTAADKLGFWERYGYHNDADPWKEERFSD